VVAAILVVAAALAVLAVIVRPHVLRPAPLSVCALVARLQDATDLSSVGDQAVIRARAAALADALGVDHGGSQQEADPAEQDRAELAGRRIRALLADPNATVQELTEALEPIASACARQQRQPRPA
jgi:hypothetical protein